MPTGAEQAATVRALVEAGNYPAAYDYIADQIRGDTDWDQRLVDWFELAAQINGPQDNFWKRWVFNFNSIAMNIDPDSAAAFQKNQEVSDRLARNVLGDYARAAETGGVVTPRQIFDQDFDQAARDFGLPPHLWPGGPFAVVFGFPVFEIYDTPVEIFDWFGHALLTAAEVAGDYAMDAIEFIGGVISALAEAIGDAAEQAFDALGEAIADLGEWLRDFQSDPIVLDLGGDGFNLTALASSTTYFDLDEDGLAERTGWVGAQDGLLVRDINGDGVVNGIGELIGSAITDGFDALALLDTNSDGVIDSADAAFSNLLVWRDLDGDGISDAGELLTLAQANIVSFGLSFVEAGTELEGNTIARIGSFLRGDGASRAMASVWFALDQTVATATVPTGAANDNNEDRLSSVEIAC